MKEEFSKRSGKVGGGILSASLAAVKYVVIPLIVAMLAVTLMGEAEGMFEDEEMDLDVSSLEDTVLEVRNMALLFGVPVVAFAFLKGFYPKGSLSRMTFGVLMVASVCVWIWAATLGGDLAFEVEQGGLGLDITPLVYLFLLGAGIKAFLYLAEYGSYRREYLGGGATGVPADAPAPVAGTAEPSREMEEAPVELANDGGEPDDLS